MVLFQHHLPGRLALGLHVLEATAILIKQQGDDTLQMPSCNGCVHHLISFRDSTPTKKSCAEKTHSTWICGYTLPALQDSLQT